MISGKIIRGIGGFYYVDTPQDGIYECRPRGIFRKEKRKPLPGDNVAISITCQEDREGSLDEIFPRKNSLIRPACANIDQILLMFAVKDPEPDFGLLDRFLISMRRQDIPVVICFHKADLAGDGQKEKLMDIYRGTGLKVLFASSATGEGMEAVTEQLAGKTTALAGPSGVGKSSLTNRLLPEAEMEVGELSRKIRRGKQTTRHTQLLRAGRETYLMDTPGFSSLFLEDLAPEELGDCYPEFAGYDQKCRFAGCAHISEPDCAVKEALAGGYICRQRYENYCLIYEELKQNRRF